MIHVLGEYGLRLGRWLVWSPFRLVLLALLIFAIGLTLAAFQANREKEASAPPPAVAEDGLPEGWQSWPQTTAVPR